MSSTEIILAILSSSILATIFTSFINWKLHNSNYKKEYYKKILDKRLAAFEIVQSLSGKMSFQASTGKFATPSICYDEKFYQSFIFQMMAAIDQSFWLDSTTSEKLTEINVFLYNNIGNKINDDWNEKQRDEKYQELGNKNWEAIRNFRKELQSLINKELKSLHNVNDFFIKNSKKSTISFSVMKSEFEQ